MVGLGETKIWAIGKTVRVQLQVNNTASTYFVVGDCNTDRPGMTDFKGKAKWDAWNAKKGVGQDDAKTQYIDLAKTMIEKYGTAS